VENSLKPIDIPSRNAAEEFAVRLVGYETAGFADVYEMEIEREHEFFAGGILAHNCRYLVKSMLRAQSQAPLEVREQEYYESLNPKADMTAKAVLMSKWKHDNAPRKGSPWAARQ